MPVRARQTSPDIKDDEANHRGKKGAAGFDSAAACGSRLRGFEQPGTHLDGAGASGAPGGISIRLAEHKQLDLDIGGDVRIGDEGDHLASGETLHLIYELPLRRVLEPSGKGDKGSRIRSSVPRSRWTSRNCWRALR